VRVGDGKKICKKNPLHIILL